MADSPEPAVQRFLTVYGWFALVVAAILYGGGAVVFFFILPAVLLHEHGLAWIAAIPLALAIGVALTAGTVLGVRRGWITLGDD